MNQALIVLITYLVFILPMLLAMGLLLYDGIFQENMSLPTRMIERLPEDDRSIATTIRDEKRRAFLIFVWLNFTTLNLLTILIYYLAYIKGENNLGSIPRISTIIMVIIAIISSFYFLAAGGGLSINLSQWKSVLESHGVSYKEYDFTDLNIKSRNNKIYLLARSYFKLINPDENVFFLPPAEYRTFQRTKNLNLREQKLRELSKLGGKAQPDQFPMPLLPIDLKRELRISKLWIPRYKKIQTILSAILMIVGYGTVVFLIFLDNIVEFTFVWPPNGSTYLLLSMSVGIIGNFWFGFAYILKELNYHETLKFILDQNHIMYDPDKDSNDYLLKILELMESKFPYQDLQLSPS